MKIKIKKIIASILTFMMIFTQVPLSSMNVYAEEETTNTNTFTIANETHVISESGIYNIEGGTLDRLNKTFIKINASQEINVQLNILGDISVGAYSESSSFFLIQSEAKVNLTITGNDHTISFGGRLLAIDVDTYYGIDKNYYHEHKIKFENVNAKVNKTVYTSNYRNNVDKYICCDLNGGSFEGGVFLEGGKVNVNDGAIINTVGKAIYARYITVNDGIISSKSYAIECDRDVYSGWGSIKLNKATIRNSTKGIYSSASGCTVSIGKDVSFINNQDDVFFGTHKYKDEIYTGSPFNLSADYNGEKIKVNTNFDFNESMEIAYYSGTLEDGYVPITTTHNSSIVEYKNGPVYLKKHVHKWNYELGKNNQILYAYCSSDEKCDYQKNQKEKISLYLDTPNKEYTPLNRYYDLKVNGNIDYMTGSKYRDQYSNLNVVYYVRDKDGNYTITNETNSHSYREGSAPWDVGTYKAKLTCNATDGKQYTIEKEFEITPVDISKVANVVLNVGSRYSNSFVYTRDEIKPTITVMANSSNNEIEKTSGYKITGVTSAKNVGDYTFTVKGTGNYVGSIEKTWHITAAEPNLNLSMSGWTYGEKPKNPIPSTNSSKPINYTYYVDENCTQLTTLENSGAANDGEKPKDAGTYWVKAAIEADGNYASKEVTKSFTIKPKTVTATVTLAEKTYDKTRNAKASSITVEAIGNEKIEFENVDKLQYKYDNSSYAQTNKNATLQSETTGNVDVIYSKGAKAKNYKINYPTNATGTIKPIIVKLEWNGKVFRYNGKERTVTARMTNILPGDEDEFLIIENNSYSDIGNYTATVELRSWRGNYVLAEEDKTYDWSIQAIPMPDATLEGTQGKNGWYKENVSLKPKTGYKISTDLNSWTDSLTITESVRDFTYYLQEESTGDISSAKKVSVNVDSDDPTGEINIKDNKFQKILNEITFGLFFKKSTTIKITGNDNSSGIDKIEYQKVSKESDYDPDGTWTEYNDTLNVNSNGKFIVYARITDNVGHRVTINSNGVVVYRDATQNTTQLEYTKTSNSNLDAYVNLEGNTIKDVAIDGNKLNSSSYTIEGAKISFKNELLDSLTAGNHEVTVSYNPLGETFVEGDMPNTTSIDLHISLANPNLNVEKTKYEKNYKDNDFNLNATHLGNGKLSYSSDNQDVAVVDKDGKVSIKGVGEARITVSLASTDIYSSASTEVYIKVNKINHKLTVKIENYEKTYGDKIFNLNALSQDNEAAIEYASSDEKVATVDNQGNVVIKGAGKTTITVSQKESNNFNAVEKTITVKANPKAITVTANDVAKTYGDADPKLTYTSDKLVGNDQLTNINLSRIEGNNKGTYKIFVSQKEGSNPNYDIDFKDGTFTINPRTIDLKWNKELTYNGKEQLPTATVSNLADGDECEVTVDGNQHKNAGTYEAKATKISNQNYKLPENVTTSYTIKPKDVTVTITPNGGTYGEKITGATAKLNDVENGDHPEVTLTYTGTGYDGTEVNGTEVPSHAGKYTVTASINDKNYNLTGTNIAEFVVKGADAGLKVKEVNDKKYGDQGFKLEVSHKGNGKLSYSSSNEDVATVDDQGNVTIHNAGTTKLKVTLGVDHNYDSDNKEVTLTVNKINHELTVDQKDVEKTYGDEAFTIHAQSKDYESAIEYASSDEKVATVDSEGNVVIKGAGKVIITVSQKESKNYKKVSKEINLTVKAKKITVTVNDASKTYGDEDSEFTYVNDKLIGNDKLTSIILTREEGEDVGTYKIKVSQKEGSNPNYDITFKDGTYTINPLLIDKGTVVLGNVLKYTGEKQTQEVEQVLVNGKALNKEDYEVLDNQATKEGKHVLTIKAKGNNHTGSFEYSYAILPKENDKIGTGSFTVKTTGDVEISRDEVIDLLIENKEITANELSEVAEGKKIEIVLEVKEAQTNELIETNTKGYKVGKYLNITLNKIVNGTSESIHELTKKLKISIELPTELINKDKTITRTYFIARSHNGKVDILETKYNEKTNSLTFETDKFSDYAIIYKDKKELKTTVTTSINKSNTKQTTKAKTGDNANIIGLMILLVSSMFVMVFVRKKEN
ncbi:MAG: hypothetical protein EGR78_06625 [Erysipelotrichaceae bacterium]|nr:hypothetical protein [Erysipelotrichaceae bacterium]